MEWLFTAFLIPLAFVIWQIRANRKLAVETGAFKQDFPSIRFNNFDLYKDVLYIVIFGANITKESKIYLEFPIEVANIGEKTTEDVYFTITFPIDSSLPYEGEFTPLLNDARPIVNRKFYKSKVDKVISYHIESIHPKVNNVLKEYFFIGESKIEDWKCFNLEFVNSYTKNLVKGSLINVHDFVTTLSCKNNVPRRVYFKIFLFACNTLDELYLKIDYSNITKIYGYPSNVFLSMLEIEPMDFPKNKSIIIGKMIGEKSGLLKEN